nr:unnamed protein product [Digitaria exilis]
MDLHDELDEHELLALTPEGLLMLFHEPTRVIRLLNPLTRHVTNLPPVTSLLEDKCLMCPACLSGIQVYGVGLADVASSMVAVCFSHPRVLAVAKPGLFYCCVGTRLMVLNTTTDQQTPRLMVAVERGSHMYFSQMADSLHLVDNAGELMLVHRSLYEGAQHEYKRKYQLYSVDLDTGALVPAKGFNGRALFMGHHRTISLAPETFPSIAADTLYLGYDFDEHLEDGSNDPSHDWTYPCSVINCLSNCIQLNGEQLA